MAERLAEEAGAITLGYFGKSIDVERKADESPVTIADREAERRIREGIAEHFPDDAIHGEEFGSTGGTSGRRWIIDPIDGTKSFIRGVPLYGTMIGVEQDGEFVVGAMRFPAIAQTISDSDLIWPSTFSAATVAPALRWAGRSASGRVASARL